VTSVHIQTPVLLVRTTPVEADPTPLTIAVIIDPAGDPVLGLMLNNLGVT